MPIQRCPVCQQVCQSLELFPEAENSVQCATCLRWYHFGCSHVTAEISNFTFKCIECDPTRESLSEYLEHMKTLGEDNKLISKEDIQVKITSLIEAQESLLVKSDDHLTALDSCRIENRTVVFYSDILTASNCDFNELGRNHDKLLDLIEEDDEIYLEKYEVAVQNFKSIKLKSEWGVKNPFNEIPIDLASFEDKKYELLKTERELKKCLKMYNRESEKLKETRREFEEYLKSKKDSISVDSKDKKANDPQLNEVLQMLMSKELRGVNIGKVNLPIFNSDPANWIQFKDIASIFLFEPHTNSTRKLLALKQATKGSANKLICNIRSGEDAHLKAYKLLCDRYDNERTLMNTELVTLFNKVKYPDLPKNVKFLLETSLSCYTNLTNIIQENIESNALFNKKEFVKLTSVDLKSRLADVFFLHAIKSRFCATLSLQFEEYIEKLQISHITIENLIDFLEKTHKKLEYSMPVIEKYSDDKMVKKFDEPHRVARVNFINKQVTCKFCERPNHQIDACRNFLKLDLKQKWNWIKEKQQCANCLKHEYSAENKCKRPPACTAKNCKRSHLTILHSEPSFRKTQNYKQNTKNVLLNKVNLNSYQTILPTAIITLKHGKNKIRVRALIDSGSEVSCISQHLVNKLRLITTEVRTGLKGLGGVDLEPSKNEVHLKMFLDDGQIIDFSAVVVKEIIAQSTNRVIKSENLRSLFAHTSDPKRDQDVEVLLGIDVYTIIMHGEQLAPGLKLHNSRIGNFITGTVRKEHPDGKTHKLCFTLNESQNDKIDNNWKSDMDGLLNESEEILETQECRKLFEETTIIKKNGRIVVRLPFRENKNELGESKSMALSRLFSLERSFKFRPGVERGYKAAIQELFKNNHVRLVTPEDPPAKFYLPSHCIVKEGKITSAYRPVFDGSAKTRNADKTPALSLNDTLRAGPKLQTDISEVLFQFRKFAYAVTADVKQLFLNIETHEVDRPYLRFLYRPSPEQKIQEVVFLRVLFGLTCSPALSLLALNLAAKKDPRTAEIVANQYFVDDLLLSVPDITEGAIDVNKMIKVLAKNHFPLQKFASNSVKLLELINCAEKEENVLFYHPKTDDDVVGTLGLCWNTKKDCFSYKIKEFVEPKVYTKRILASHVSSLYDPIGILSVVTVKFKFIFQDACKKVTGWDEPLDPEVVAEYLECKADIKLLETIKIPRWIEYENGDKLQLFGFADASMRAAASLVYSRVIKPDNSIVIRLLAGKTKVCPEKGISLPRCEFLAMELLANLIVKVAKSLKLELNSETAMLFSDSQIALSWVQCTEIEKKSAFIARRAIKISKLVDRNLWRHISSELNVADLPSRGMGIREFLNTTEYWCPSAINTLNLDFPYKKYYSCEENRKDYAEAKLINLTTSDAEVQKGEEKCITERFSSMNKLVRIVA